MGDMKNRIATREEIRQRLRDESMTWGDIYELQCLGDEGMIEPGDVELLEWAMDEDTARERGLI